MFLIDLALVFSMLRPQFLANIHKQHGFFLPLLSSTMFLARSSNRNLMDPHSMLCATSMLTRILKCSGLRSISPVGRNQFIACKVHPEVGCLNAFDLGFFSKLWTLRVLRSRCLTTERQWRRATCNWSAVARCCSDRPGSPDDLTMTLEWP